MGWVPGWGTKIPHAAEQLSPHITIREVQVATKTQHSTLTKKKKYELNYFFLKIRKDMTERDSHPQQALLREQGVGIWVEVYKRGLLLTAGTARLSLEGLP